MKILSFVDGGLGHTSYLIDLDNGGALVIDPARLPSRQLAAAERLGLAINFTADTHTHADYVSGSPDLARNGAGAGAGVGVGFVAPAAAGLSMPHRGVGHGDEVDLGRYRLRCIATPGHTPDHLSYILVDDGTPVALFSGGSLMVGTVGRTDLVDDDRTETLARAMFHSLHEHILTLPDDLAVYPTHGAGSFCSAPGGSARTTTIGRERTGNPMLQTDSEDEFVARLIESLGTFPSYFRRLPALNQRGAPPHDDIPPLRSLDPGLVAELQAQGAQVIDARPFRAFAAAHLPGSIANQLRPVFATWLGWLSDPGRPLVFVLDDDQDEADLVRQCLTIGLEDLVGRLAGGIDAWIGTGRPIASLTLVEATDLDGTATVLDVRQANEFAAGHIPAATHIELGRLAQSRIPDGPVVTMCGKTERAMTAASLLQAAGHPEIAVLHGGYGAWSGLPGNDAAR